MRRAGERPVRTTGRDRPRSARSRPGPGVGSVQSVSVPVTSSAASRHRPGAARIRELLTFGLVGGACSVVDLLLFQLLYTQLGAGALGAKLGATAVSTTLAFLAHRSWSFVHRSRPGLRREYSVFVLVNVVTLVIGLAIVALVRYPLGQQSALVLQLANIVSIGVGTALRYLSYRRWVFPAPAASLA